MSRISPQAPNHTGYPLLVLPGTVDLAALAATRPDRYPYWLTSTAALGPNARYDILFAFPQERLVALPDGRLVLDGKPLGGSGGAGEEGGFLARFDALWSEHARRLAPFAPPPAAALPFSGGWFLFLGYELAQEIEPVLRAPFGARPADPRLPRACAERIPAAILCDHLERRTVLVAEPGCGHLLEPMQEDLRTLTQPAAAVAAEAPIALTLLEEEDPAHFLEGVRRVKEYIAAGDVFQVNLSRAWRARLVREVSPFALHRRLAAANPAPFAALANFPSEGSTIVSSSPERLVEVRGRGIRTRPIAGTFPRSADPALDRAWAAALKRHPKERAEHIMLIDLERNDLGRLCRPGSVRVSELMTVESYRHVHHLVSEVCGELEEGVTPAAVVRALFPGGTITGCPKVRCMQIIAELEPVARGAYTGSLGYVNHDGSLDLNILIRTLVTAGGEVWWRAGAGIVADSVPERELAETRAKARGLLAALTDRAEKCS